MQTIDDRPSLRARQAELVRAAILDALVARLEREAPAELSVDELARDAGVSRRTLYRYFPNRAALLAAAEERLVARLGLSIDIAGPEAISAAFRAGSRRLEQHPGLARALRQTLVGRTLRPPLRARRVAALVRALEPLTRHLDAAEARRVEAVVAYLHSANAWVMIGDESGLPGDEIRAAVTWAIETLLDDVRRRGGKTGGRS
jgi:AcrR family transcriptional regulator